MVYGLHFATNIVREHYPAFSLAERGTLRVDPYLGLHPDLFALEGRGAFINNNPGASLFGAVPYLIVRPGVDAVVARVQAARARAGGPGEARYDAPEHPNSQRFFAETRARGLDVRFGLASLAIHALGVAPLGAACALVMRRLLRRRGVSESGATLLALLFAFGTPVFFRGGFLNQNLLVAQLELLAFALVDRAGERAPSPLRLAAAGACLGAGVLCDYSGVVPLAVLGLWTAADCARRDGFAAGGRAAAWLAIGGAPPLLGLLGYQAWAFGNPFLPAQHYMPASEYEFAGRGYAGVSAPALDLLLQNLVDPRFGLFAFGPLLVLALAAPFAARREGALLGGREVALALALFVALLLFASSIQYGRLQWNTGVRYLVPAVPLLFLASAAVLVRLPRPVAWIAGALAVFHGFCLAMVREDVPTSLATVLREGPKLPWLTVLGRMGGQYLDALGGLRPTPLLFLGVLAVLAALLWWPAAVRGGRAAEARR
jgi:hypothetical protein